MHTRGKVITALQTFSAAKVVVEKIREGLIHNAKVKRAYYRTLKREEKAGNIPSSIIIEDNVHVHKYVFSKLMFRNSVLQIYKVYILHDRLHLRRVLKNHKNGHKKQHSHAKRRSR